MAEVGDSSDEKPVKTLVEALCYKYLDSMEESCEIQVYVPKRGPAKLSDSGHLILPRIIHLNDCDVGLAGNTDDIQRMCCDVSELDLTQNCLSEWQEVFRIIEKIPKLDFLNLTSNPLNSLLNNFPEDMSFPGIHQLVLNHTNVEWGCVEKLLRCFPSLTELHLSLNSYTCIDFPTSLEYPTLSKLHFNGNSVSSWEEICKLGRAFTNLEHLVMVETKLCTIDPKESVASTFPKLKILNLNKTCLENWDEIDKLRCFPMLSDVRLLGIPFLEKYPEKKRRQLLIARTPNIARLNGSPVLDTEREDAERMFLRYYMEKDQRPDRYDELEAVYGKLDPLVKLNLTPKTRFSVKVKFEDREEDMQIDTQQTVLQFKKLLAMFVGHPPSKWRLFYDDLHGSQGPDELKYPNRNLYDELESVYGKLEPLVILNLAPKTHFSVKVKFEDREENMQVDTQQTVLQFKKLLAMFVGHPPSKWHLYYNDLQGCQGPDEMKYPNRNLYAYDITDGDEFYVVMK